MTTQRRLMGNGVSWVGARSVVGQRGAITSTGTGSIANATQLPYDLNFLTTGAGTDSFVLPSTAQGSVIGDEIQVYLRSGQTTAVIYAASGELINGAATISNAAAKMAYFKRFTATDWGCVKTA